MRRSLPVAATAVTTLLVALSVAACDGSSTSSGSTSTTSASTATTTTTGSGVPSDAEVAWIDKVCGEIVKLTESQPPPPPNVTSSDVAQALKAFDQYIGANIDMVDKTISNIRSVGPSPIPGADQDLNTLLNGLTSLKQGYETTRAKFATVNPSNPQAAQSAMIEAFTSLGKGAEDLSKAFESLDSNKQIKEAGDKAPNCQKLGTGPSTTATTTTATTTS